MTYADLVRERLFTMRMSDEESARLDFIAKHYGLNAANAIRMVLKKEEARIRDELAARGIAPPTGAGGIKPPGSKPAKKRSK